MINRLWSHRDFVITELLTDGEWIIREWLPGQVMGPFVGAELTRLAAQKRLDRIIRERNAWYDGAPAVAFDCGGDDGNEEAEDSLSGDLRTRHDTQARVHARTHECYGTTRSCGSSHTQGWKVR